ncbi:MAG TPA: aldo/keto reductase [Thermoanaerobaculia bacterium]|jgi:aryl-alcohol dehydrogenase-like predicted oxidoreductase
MTITRRTAVQLGAAATAALLVSPLRAAEEKLHVRQIPSSGEWLPVVGIGTARRFDVATAEEREPLLQVLFELPRLGGRLVDTAPSYGMSEAVVGSLVARLGNRKELFLATKVGAGRSGVDAGIAEMKQSFLRLQTDRIDLMQIHNLNGVDEMLPVLRKWKDEGRIRYLGISTSNAQQYAQLETIMKREPLDFIQVDYALDNRAAGERILPLAQDRKIAVLTNLPFGRGRVLQAFKDRPIPAWAAKLGITSWAQFALKYVVSHPAVTSAIPGTARLAYLRDNLGAARGPMPDAKTRTKMVELLQSA